jgi:hypothetical protein
MEKIGSGTKRSFAWIRREYQGLAGIYGADSELMKSLRRALWYRLFSYVGPIGAIHLYKELTGLDPGDLEI